MKGLLFCLLCLSGCGYSLQGNWKGGQGEQIKMEFRSDGSILEQGVKAELLTWHGDYISLNKNNILADATERAAQGKKRITDAAAQFKKQNLEGYAKQKQSLLERKQRVHDNSLRYHESEVQLDKQLKDLDVQREKQLKWYEDEYFGKQLKENDAYLERVKNMKGAEWSRYFSTVVDAKDISESADKVEVRIHWVDADHFDLGSTSFVRVKEKN